MNLKQTQRSHRNLFSLASLFNSDESRLRSILLQNYVPQARPVLNPTTVTHVDVGLSIIQVMSLVSKFHFRKCLLMKSNLG